MSIVPSSAQPLPASLPLKKGTIVPPFAKSTRQHVRGWQPTRNTDGLPARSRRAGVTSLFCRDDRSVGAIPPLKKKRSQSHRRVTHQHPVGWHHPRVPTRRPARPQALPSVKTPPRRRRFAARPDRLDATPMESIRITSTKTSHGFDHCNRACASNRPARAFWLCVRASRADPSVRYIRLGHLHLPGHRQRPRQGHADILALARAVGDDRILEWAGPVEESVQRARTPSLCRSRTAEAAWPNRTTI